MGQMIKIISAGEPIGKKTVRFVGKKRKGKYTYNPNETAEGRFLLDVYRQIGNDFKIIEGPVSIILLLFAGRPKGHFGSGKNAGKLKESAPSIPITKPDCSNAIKFYEDCFNNIVWKDDKQIFDVHAIRRYSDNPRVEIYINEV